MVSCGNAGPHAATMAYQLDDELSFYFVMKANTEKYKNIQRNSLVALTVSNNDQWREVQAKGEAEILSDKDGALWLEDFLEKVEEDANYWAPAPPLKLRGEELAVVKVVPNWLRYADFKLLKNSAGGEGFDVIIPEGGGQD